MSMEPMSFFFLLVMLVIQKVSGQEQNFFVVGRNLTSDKWSLLKQAFRHWSIDGLWVQEWNGVDYHITYPHRDSLCYPGGSCDNLFPRDGVVAKYTWSVKPTDPRFPPYQSQFSKERFCRVFGGENLLLVGDSLTDHFRTYIALAVAQQQIPSLCEGMGGRMDCSAYSKADVGLFFIRSDRLTITSVTVEESTGTLTNYVHHNWTTSLNELNISLLILNRGAHYSSDEFLVRNLDHVFGFLKQFHPNISVIYRNTPAGHPHCEDYALAPPLSAPMDLNIDRGAHSNDSAHRYHWNEFARQNELTRQLIDEKHPSVVLMDAATLTALRADRHHIRFGDCLHYCHHSVHDDWILLLLNIVEQLKIF